MAKNLRLTDGYHLSLPLSAPTSPNPLSGQAGRLGALTGVAQTDLNGGGNPTGTATMDLRQAAYDLPVHAIDDSGNSAVNIGDNLFFTDADAPNLTKKSSGYFFGVAIPEPSSQGAAGAQLIAAGATATITVLHVPSPGSGTLSAGGVGSTQLAAGGVIASKLSATLATGMIPLSLASARKIVANDLPAVAASGGLLGLDTDPKLKRTNGATDPSLMIEWAATSVIPIQFSVPYPSDLDDTQPVVVNMMAVMGGGTDTPVVGVAYWEGIGGTNVGGNTGTVTNAIGKKTVSVAGASIGAYPLEASVILTPAAHGTDVLRLYGVWLEYARK